MKLENIMYKVLCPFLLLKRKYRSHLIRPYINQNNNPLICYRLFKNEHERLNPILSPLKEAISLSNEIVQKTGIVNVYGHLFDLSRPGVYRFYKLPVISEQRIVLKEKNFEEISQCIGYLWSYGFEGMLRDNLSPEKSNCHKKILVSSCTDIANISRSILSCFNIKSRIIALWTLNEWGGQDDGHTLLEVFDDVQGWFIYDPSFGILFLDENNKRLSAFDFQEYVRDNRDFLMVELPRSKSHSAFRHSNYDYGFWLDEKYHSIQVLKDWYKKIAGVLLFDLNGKYIFCKDNISETDIFRLKKIGFLPMDKKDFLSIMYPRIN